MLALLSDIVAVMAPVFLIAALGYGWARAELPYDGPFITTLMINVATPCLVFATLLRLRFEATELATVATRLAGTAWRWPPIASRFAGVAPDAVCPCGSICRR